MAFIVSDQVALSTAQTGNGDSTNIAQVEAGTSREGVIVITSAVGATPTVTVNIQGSVDGTNWVNIPYLAAGTWTGTFVATAIVITTAVTNFYVLQTGLAWRYVKLAYTANTNVTLTATAFV